MSAPLLKTFHIQSAVLLSVSLFLLMAAADGMPAVALPHRLGAAAKADAGTVTRFNEATQSLNEGIRLYRNSHFQEAVEPLQRAIALYRERSIQQQFGDRSRQNLANALNFLGETYRNLGQFDTAIATFNEALELVEDLNNLQGEGTIRNNLGVVYNAQGRYEEALEMLNQALKISQEGDNTFGVLTALGNLRLIYRTLGQEDQAEAILQEIRRISAELHQGSGALGEIPPEYETLIYAGSIEDVITNLTAELERRRSADDRPGEADVLGLLGVAYYTAQRNSEAVVTIQEQLTLLRELNDRPGEAQALNNLSLPFIETNQYDRALEALQQSLMLKRELGDRPGEGLTLANMGQVLAELKQPELAIAFLKQAINVWEELRQNLSSENSQSYTEKRSNKYRLLADLLLQQDRVLEAHQVLDLLRVQELDEYLADVRGNDRTAKGIAFWPAEQQILDLYRQTQPETFSTFVSSPDVAAQIQELRRDAQGQNLNLAYLSSLQDDLAQLQQKAALFYPLVLDDRLELVLIKPGSRPIRHTVRVGRRQINQAILQFRQEVQLHWGGNEIAQQFYQWLIEPMEDDLDGIESIIYAADGALRYIPLSALYDGKNRLIERFSISQITAASLTDFGATDPQTPRILAGAFSEGSYTFRVGDRESRFSGLHYAGAEVETIATEIPNTTSLFNLDFNRQAIEQQMGNYTVLHLATHGHFEPGPPENSFILLGNGDRITLRDISNWHLPNMDLVVLSACETAVSSSGMGNGEEILGFGYQLQRTGARAAIASLWSVDDEATMHLMTRFYEIWAQGETTKAEALRQAQIALIQDRRHPIYWAPFVLIGNGF